jgi:hypothetical protein
VDVLLALLSKRTAPLPSAPLREAVEAAFRAMAESVTVTGASQFQPTHLQEQYLAGTFCCRTRATAGHPFSV